MLPFVRRALVLLLLASCGKSTSSSPAATTAPSASAHAVALPGGTPCGALGCTQFDTLAAALDATLASRPLVLGVGEAHAQKGKEGVASSAKHFTDEVLPLLKGRTSDLVVELMAPGRKPDGSSCVETTAAVKEQQKVVTERQATTNQNEYVVMGEAAKKLGIVPDLLRPSCDELAAIQKAGDDMIPLTLETIARLTRVKVEHLLERNRGSEVDRDKLVVAYGGALHNDLVVPPERASWTYGPALAKTTGGRYVELDLYVADFVEDTDAWKKLPWYPHWDRDRLGGKITVYRPSEGSWVIVLPKSK
jgi:hypothetical protein